MECESTFPTTDIWIRSDVNTTEGRRAALAA